MQNIAGASQYPGHSPLTHCNWRETLWYCHSYLICLYSGAIIISSCDQFLFCLCVGSDSRCCWSNYDFKAYSITAQWHPSTCGHHHRRASRVILSLNFLTIFHKVNRLTDSFYCINLGYRAFPSAWISI